MTDRKPPGVSWETYVDRQIREGQEQGAFTGLSGQGKPIADLDRPVDDLWWVRRKLREEQLGSLPPALQLKRDVELARERIAAARTEDAVRRIVADVNAHIRYTNRTIVTGPPSTTMPLDVERELVRWRQARVSDGHGT
jgi:hypothetical protein